ncbi:MAG TPA: alkaline phosphatase family protein [Bacteroidia bacterium]|nr:alkaline phosphatase family protein [Bacteroidia bacterium]
MKKITNYLSALCVLLSAYSLQAQYIGKTPAHVIVVMEENYAYAKIIGSSLAPTFTALSKASYCANMTLATAITHPSEPNYLDLFSGQEQGVTTDQTATVGPLNDCNLGSQIIQSGHTFIGYSEGQPSVGYIGPDVGNYYIKHCPWINWIGHNTNPDTIPVTSDQPYTAFPDSLHYANLPNMAWVIPNSIDDMHDGAASSAIPNGDTWFKKNMMPLVRWAANPANNAIVLVIWDEDDYSSSSPSNHIPLLVCSGLVIGGNYGTAVNHYTTLKLMEEMFGLAVCDATNQNSAGEYPTNMWTVTTATNSIAQPINEVTTWPVPAKNELNIHISSVNDGKVNIGLYDITGRIVKEMPAELKSGDNYLAISTDDVSNGIYFLNVVGEKINVCKKIVVGK